MPHHSEIFCYEELLYKIEALEEAEEVRLQQERMKLEEKLTEKIKEKDARIEMEEAGAAGTYRTAKDRAADYRSSGYALTIVGALGLVALLLYGLGVIPIKMGDNIRLITIVTLTVMFLFFLCMGIRSFIDAKKANAVSKEEEETDNEIMDWFAFNYNADSIDEDLDLKADELEEEIKYFSRVAYMKEKITGQYPELEPSYLDNLVEEIYLKTYEH